MERKTVIFLIQDFLLLSAGRGSEKSVKFLHKPIPHNKQKTNDFNESLMPDVQIGENTGFLPPEKRVIVIKEISGAEEEQWHRNVFSEDKSAGIQYYYGLYYWRIVYICGTIPADLRAYFFSVQRIGL